jgi:hypothetical protein
MRRLARIVVLSVCTAVGLPLPLLAADPAKLEVAAAKVPEGVAEPIRRALSETVLRLSLDGEPAFEFWFRADLPLAEKPDGGTLGTGTLKEGTVLGVVRVTGERYDFRNEEIPAGVYIVRLGLQPEDGNHLGVAPTRTFALLLPAQQDTRLEPIAHKDLMKAAATINAARHPTNLNLQPVETSQGDFPRLEARSGGQHKAVLVRLPGRVGQSGEPTTLTFALVYEGTGQI